MGMCKPGAGFFKGWGWERLSTQQRGARESFDYCVLVVTYSLATIFLNF